MRRKMELAEFESLAVYLDAAVEEVRARNGDVLREDRVGGPTTAAELLEVITRVAEARSQAALPGPRGGGSGFRPPRDEKDREAFAAAYFYRHMHTEAGLLGEVARFLSAEVLRLEAAANRAERIAVRLEATLSFKVVDGLDEAEDEGTWAAAALLREVLAVEYRELASQFRKAAATAAADAKARRNRRYSPGTPDGEGGAGDPGGGGGAAPASGGGAAPAPKPPKGGKRRKRS